MPLTEEQRVIRRKGVTGSEIATIVGLNPYRSVQEVWEEKMGLLERDPELENNPNIERGVFLEPALIQWTGKRVGRAAVPNQKTYVSKHHDLIIATPDGFLLDDHPYSEQAFGTLQDYDLATQPRRVIEVKAPSPRTYEDWADPEEVPDGAPPYYLPQVAWEMAATDLQEAVVSALIGGQLRVYRLKRNQPFIDALTKRAEAFWGFVVKQEPPPVDFTRQLERDWMRKHLRNQPSDEMKEFLGPDSEQLEQHVQKFIELKAQAEQVEAELDQMKAVLQWSVGDAAGFHTPQYKVTWKKAKASWKTDWKRFFNTIKKAYPDRTPAFEQILTECDYSFDGSRRLLVTQRKDV